MTSHRPRKRYGQNFLRDQVVLDRIVSAAELRHGNQILEIGPGQGALTVRLLATELPVTAVEIDRDLATALEQRNEESLDVIVGDVLRLDWSILLPSPPYKLVANLPYNVSSQVLFKVLDHRLSFECLVLMFQKEVGDRLVAVEGTREYGVLSVLMQAWFDIDKVVKVPPQAFNPAPKVDSVVLKLTPLRQSRVTITNEAIFKRVVKGAFAQRRKTLRNSLIGSGMDVAVLDRVFAHTGIDPRRRGETLNLGEFASLSNCLDEIETGD